MTSSRESTGETDAEFHARMEAEYAKDELAARDAITRLVTHWGIDGLILAEAVTKWIERADDAL